MYRKLVGLSLVCLLGMGGCVEKENKPKKEKIENVEQVNKTNQTKEIEEKYLKVVYDSAIESTKASEELQKLFNEATNSPELLLTDSWKYQLARVYDTIQSNYNDIRNYPESEIPENLKESHKYLVQGYDYYMQSKDKILEAVETIDPNKMKEGVDLILKSEENIAQSNRLRQKMIDKN